MSVPHRASSSAGSDVWLRGKRVARLHREGDFKHTLVYEQGTDGHDFVSLTMPVRPAAWEWPELHPFFRMNLPEGYQLQLLKEAFGSILDGTDLTLLGLVGGNPIGRVQVVPDGQKPVDGAIAFDLKDVLKGDNGEEAFRERLRAHLLNAVSGVMPKFLAPREAGDAFLKGSVVTHGAIVKGSSINLPYLALNEHLAMTAVRRAGIEAATSTLSDDGLALVVDRFDTNAAGELQLGFEDFCSLLGMRPAEKYDTTWERIAQQLRRLVQPGNRPREMEKLVRQVVATHVLRNADCHSKNVAVLYSDANDVRVAPMYDVVTTVAYDGYRNSPPALLLGGRKTWNPGRSLMQFALSCGLSPSLYKSIVEQTCDAVADSVPDVVAATRAFPAFRETGKRMLLAWQDGVVEAMRSVKGNATPIESIGKQLEAARISDPERETPVGRSGRSELLGKR